MSADKYNEYKRACATLQDERCKINRDEYKTLPYEKLSIHRATLQDCAQRACTCADQREQYMLDFVNVKDRNSGHAYQIDLATAECQQRLDYVRELVAYSKTLAARKSSYNSEDDKSLSDASTVLNRFESLTLSNSGTNSNSNSNSKTNSIVNSNTYNIYDPARPVVDDWEEHLSDARQTGAAATTWTPGIWKRIVARVRKDGMKSLAKAWLAKLKRLPPPTTAAQAHKYLRMYHSHTSLFMKTLEKHSAVVPRKRDLDPKRLRPDPVFKFNAKSRIGTMTFFHFILAGLGTPKEEEKVKAALAKRVQTQLKSWERAGMRGLILDFRKHYGGSFYPLLQGFARYLVGVPLFNWVDDAPCSSKTSKTLQQPKWLTLTKSTDKYAKDVRHPSDFINHTKAPVPIALILGPMTYSSGEIAAAMFAGKARVMSFGEPTGGGLSVNEEYAIDGYTLLLTRQIVVLSNGTYNAKQRLEPDIPSENPLVAARRWILSHSQTI